MPLWKPSQRVSCRLQALQLCCEFPISRTKHHSSLTTTEHHICLFRMTISAQNLTIALVLFCFWDQWTSEKYKGNLQILTQHKLIYKMGVLRYKRMRCFTSSSVPDPFPKMHRKQTPKHKLQRVQNVQALPPDKRVKVTAPTPPANWRRIMVEWNNLNQRYF